MQHVIIGNGAAGIVAAEKIRELRPDDEITVVSGEDTPAYSKCMLPDFIGGKLSKEKILIRDRAFYEKNRILLLGKMAVRIDTGNKCVCLDDEAKLPYDKLLLAMGGVPFKPPVEGLADSEHFTVNSLADAETMISKARAGTRALILGAGLTGIEIGFALKRLGMEVLCVEKMERILPKQLDVGSSQVLVDGLRVEGIDLRLGVSVSRIVQGKRSTAVLMDGNCIEYDMLVLSIGTRPNIGMVKDSGIDCGLGVLTDESMLTSVDGVYAAGDAAEAIDKLSGEYVQSYLWPNAMAQGRCAAMGMAGSPSKFSKQAAMMNPVQLRDIPFMSMGIVNPQGEGFEVLLDNDRARRVYKRLILKDHRIKGMISLGDMKYANAIAGLIRKGTDISGIRDRLFLSGF